MISGTFKSLAATLLVLLATGCATQKKPYDYAEFKAARPASILVLPPVNNSSEVIAPYGLMSQATQPLAESGYYVIPVSLAAETFKQNGLSNPTDIQELPPAKLRQIFGADTALYMTITNYGTAYKVVQSETLVSADAKLVDLRSGKLLWEGSARASSLEQQQNSGGGLLGVLVSAMVNQIINTASDTSYKMAGITSYRLLRAGSQNGLLYGPRSPQYQKD
ncbi:DUF799 domain-containing protein [Herbaspirillum sp. AP02]|uniref:DUF799 domain-containing protein n=1 Tax=Herbaspirillum frisingense TaxID=92645 RepID=A0ABU1PCJ6_9BURK|nr:MULTISPECIES: DUF799 domain-containing protein [Herbaspirillum]MBG7621653.1 DUF799 domain-containing protein [Herbaspirillum sp. AP02]MDR6583655.1 hypothetical protein [Herbaspirillum frisingense]NZD69740.1 DUF799 domain-containing protein [Herbaspirillum sp. AP21]PLY58668.1 hypothetical protein HBH1_02865 [Herbaspirillum sp. BH-1]QNB08553.1 DUF799 domain-containing protein [Herbaspirillum frisingense]